MSDPLSLVPFALAAGGGSVNGLPTGQLVAAGITLLQRSVPLVRALSGRCSAILLPAGNEMVVAWAASDGRGAVMIDPTVSDVILRQLLADANVGAVFTMAAMAPRIPSGLTVVVLDNSPRSATVVGPERTQCVDLGSHFGMELSGSREVDGADEVWVMEVGTDSTFREFTHREALADARDVTRHYAFTPADHIALVAPHYRVDALSQYCIAPLLVGGRVSFFDRHQQADISWGALAALGITRVAASQAVLEFLAHDHAHGMIRNVWCIDGGPVKTCANS